MPSTPDSGLRGLRFWLLWPILAVNVVILLAVPLHRLILPTWPPALKEAIRVDPGDGSTAVFRLANGAPSERRDHAVYTRPMNLTLIEHGEDGHRLGYVVGARDSETGELRDDWSATDWTWLEAGQLPPGAVLLLTDADGETEQIAAEAVTRLIRPNRMGLVERAHLTFVRLREMWQARR